jgi:hypothetical protein
MRSCKFMLTDRGRVQLQQVKERVTLNRIGTANSGTGGRDRLQDAGCPSRVCPGNAVMFAVCSRIARRFG